MGDGLVWEIEGGCAFFGLAVKFVVSLVKASRDKPKQRAEGGRSVKMPKAEVLSHNREHNWWNHTEKKIIALDLGL